MKLRALLFVTLLLVWAGFCLAQGPVVFSVEATAVAGDEWNGMRYQVSPDDFYPWPSAQWWALYQGRGALNPDDPAVTIPPLFIPLDPENRFFTVPKPDFSPGPWHTVVHVLDSEGAVVARTDDFIVDVEAGNYVYNLPAMSVGYGLQSAVQVINPGKATALVSIHLYDLATGSVIVSNTVDISGGAGTSFFLADWTALFAGYVTVYSDRPLLVTGMAGVNILAGNYLVNAVPR